MDAAARPIRTEAERNPMIEAGSGFWWMMAAIALYFLAMVGIGLWASTRTNDKDDYMIGGRDLPAPVAALSAGASDMSGWLLMGLPGALYLGGMAQSWIAIGLTLGAWVNWKVVAPRLRLFTEQYGNAITLPSYFGNRLVRGGRMLRVVSGLVILILHTKETSGAERIVQNGVVMLRERIEVLTKGAAEEFGLPGGCDKCG